MKHCIYLPLLCLLSTQCIGQTCDSVKRQAVTWVIERNECRELLGVAEQQIVALRASDSLNRLASDKYKHSTDILGKALVKCEQEKNEAEEDRDKYQQQKRRRLALLPVGVVIGFLVGLFI